MSLQDTFLTWWLKSARYPWSKLRRALFEGSYLSKPLPEVHSLEDIESCMRQITWKRDMWPELFDCVSYPQRVWDKKADDCDGFSVLAAALLSQWSPDTDPVMVTAMVDPLANAHSVCVFKQGGGLRYFNNSTLKPNTYQSYQDVIADFLKPSDRLICWDVVKPGTLEALEFHNA